MGGGRRKSSGAFLGRGFLHALASTEVELQPAIGATKAGKVTFKGEAFRDIMNLSFEPSLYLPIL
jgi:hypothetical protein